MEATENRYLSLSAYETLRDTNNLIVSANGIYVLRERDKHDKQKTLYEVCDAGVIRSPDKELHDAEPGDILVLLLPVASEEWEDWRQTQENNE